jgi:hypothetical protein
MTPRTFLPCVLLVLALVSPPMAVAQDPPAEEKPGAEAEGGAKEGDDEEVKIGPASKEIVKKLLADYRKAVNTKEGGQIRAALEAMQPYDNEAFKAPALKEMKYKASSADKKVVALRARKKNVRKQKYRLKMVFEFEQSVQIAAVTILSRHKDKDVGSALRKLFSNKQVQDDKQALHAHVILAMGSIGYTKLWKEIESEFKRFRNKDVMKAAVRYFGMTKEKRVAKMLCAHIEEPMPGNVNSGTNPPASYWKVRWEAWNNMKDDVVWALEQITGETFTTNKQARDWVGDHANKHGYK